MATCDRKAPANDLQLNSMKTTLNSVNFVPSPFLSPLVLPLLLTTPCIKYTSISRSYFVTPVRIPAFIESETDKLNGTARALRARRDALPSDSARVIFLVGGVLANNVTTNHRGRRLC